MRRRPTPGAGRGRPRAKGCQQGLLPRGRAHGRAARAVGHPTAPRRSHTPPCACARAPQGEELEERLGASVKRVLGRNRVLGEELRLHAQARAPAPAWRAACFRARLCAPRASGARAPASRRRPTAPARATHARPRPARAQESDALQAEARLLAAERARLLRELSLKEELEGRYARRGAAQGAALKAAQVRRVRARA